MRSRLSLLALVLLAPASARAADFYVDPATGSMSNDGSSAHPWSTLAEVITAKKISTQGWDAYPYKDGATLVATNPGAPVKAGDTLWLRSGYHGDVAIDDHYNASVITVAAAPGQTPRLGHLAMNGGQNWLFRGLSFSPSYAPTYVPDKAMVSLLNPGYQGPIHDITIDGCSLESVPDTSAWTGDQWLTLPADGFDVRGSKQTLRNNHLHNVRFGIAVQAADSLIEHNVVDSFGNGDGMRGLGDNSVFQYNVVKNAHHPDPVASNGNHDDGFQSWSLGVDPSDGKTKPGFGVIKGVVLRGNLFINDEKLDEPYFSNMQGVGCFDGMYEGFVIENNVVIASTYHGISLYGATNCRIVNNTVINRADDKLVPWIRVYDHKNGTLSTGNVLRNNLSSALGDQSKGVVSDHNLLITKASAPSLFVAPATFDLHLLPGAPAIDQGTLEGSPAADADGVPRPQGKGVDLGAYEWHDGPVAGAAGSSGTSGQAGSTTSAGGTGGTSAGGSGGSPKAGASGSSAAGQGSSGAGGSSVSGAGGSSVSGASGHGGAGAAAGQAGASGQPAASEPAGDDGGCGCRQAPVTPPHPWTTAPLLAVLMVVRRRRREPVTVRGS